MTIRETIDTFYLCRLSKPQQERELYRLIRRARPRAIVELGLESHERSLRLIRLARRCSPGLALRFSGIDLFDARPDNQPSMTLKATHRLLSGSGASIRLIPGDAFSALSRCANQLQDTELLIISSSQESGALEAAWKYVPRMLSENAVVLRAVSGGAGAGFQRVTTTEWQACAEAAQRRRRAA